MLFIEFIIISALCVMLYDQMKTNWVILIMLAVLLGVNIAEYDQKIREKDNTSLIYNLQTTTTVNSYSHLGLKYDTE